MDDELVATNAIEGLSHVLESVNHILATVPYCNTPLITVAMRRPYSDNSHDAVLSADNINEDQDEYLITHAKIEKQMCDGIILLIDVESIPSELLPDGPDTRNGTETLNDLKLMLLQGKAAARTIPKNHILMTRLWLSTEWDAHPPAFCAGSTVLRESDVHHMHSFMVLTDLTAAIHLGIASIESQQLAMVTEQLLKEEVPAEARHAFDRWWTHPAMADIHGYSDEAELLRKYLPALLTQSFD